MTLPRSFILHHFCPLTITQARPHLVVCSKRTPTDSDKSLAWRTSVETSSNCKQKNSSTAPTKAKSQEPAYLQAPLNSYSTNGAIQINRYYNMRHRSLNFIPNYPEIAEFSSLGL